MGPPVEDWVKFPAKVLEVLSPPTRQVTGAKLVWAPEMRVVVVSVPERLPIGMTMPSVGGVAL
jgi:ABC-type enterobactin transport system permease subunit